GVVCENRRRHAADYRMTTIDATLRGAIAGAGDDLILTLDPAFQGLPDAAHGGSVLALFEALAARRGARTVRGHYRRRVPLGVPLALTTLLDEAAFWLGALASGESGMTTELTVTLHGDPTGAGAIVVGGERAATRPRANDPRYWQTRLHARDETGRLLATATITFA